MIEQFEAGMLFSENDWKEHCEKLRNKVVPSSPEQIAVALENAVKKRIPSDKFGLFLSGGVDSSLLALLLKKHTDNFICYSVGISGSSDLAAAKVAADKLNLNLVWKEFSFEEVEHIAKRTAQIVPNVDVVSIGVGSVVLAAAELAKTDNVHIFFGGLGSEEIFAGYERHVHSKDINDECWSGLANVMWGRDLVRDAALGLSLGISVRVPFLDDSVILAAMGIPSNKKINSEHKKVILREVAESLGLPFEIAWRKKKAAQYGSGFDKALEQLAKKKGVSKSEFVQHLGE